MAMDESRKMYVEMPIVVHTYDVDYMQIISNTVYIKWLEDMRMAILDKYFPLTEMLKSHSSPILGETHIQYKHPVTFGCKPQGRCWIWLTPAMHRINVVFPHPDGPKIHKKSSS